MTSASQPNTTASRNRTASLDATASRKIALPQSVLHEASRPLVLPEALAELNRIYVQEVARRALLTPAEAAAWLDQQVTVFLRHDKVRVFAIVCNDSVAMADFVTLADAEFHVNAVGRQQSNQMQGPLPNQRTVHAYLTGRLTQLADGGRLPDPEVWEPVVYNPIRMNCFQRAESSQPVFVSSEVKLVPGSQKVWCLREKNQRLRTEFSGWPS